MSQLSFIEQAPDYFIVEGELTFASIDKNTLKFIKFAKGSKQLTIDLAKVAATDSAGLALMIEWIKLSHSNQVLLRFKNIPRQLQALARLSGFDKNPYFSSNTESVAVNH